MKLSDYVVDFLYRRGIKHAFVVQGGAIAHMIDSVGQHPHMKYICTAHEQAGAMAVHGYYAASGRMACGMATTGPGVVNMMTGIACLYYDSLPGIFIGGQVSVGRLMCNAPGVRQLGFQESPHVEMVKHITKYAAIIDSPFRVRYELEKAFHLATEGRPGPVFLDICDDVQRMDVNPDELIGYVPPDDPAKDPGILRAQLRNALDLLARAERPVLILGAGVRLSGQVEEAQDLVRRLGIPVALTWAMQDMLSWDDPLNAGGFGISATRRGNFAVQNADFILSIGSRLDTHATGTPLSTFGREASKVIVDIDPAELHKFKSQNMPCFTIQADVGEFLACEEWKVRPIARDITPWLKQIIVWRQRYPSVSDEDRKQATYVNPYYFLEVLSAECLGDEVITVDTGANLVQTFQAFRNRWPQRMISALNMSPMGYSLPAAIGAAHAGKRVICIIGDGGLQMCLRELGGVVKAGLPIKIFVFNNHGYGMQKQTQEEWIDGRLAASDTSGDLADMDYTSIARAYGMEAVLVGGNAPLKTAVSAILAHSAPTLCCLDISPDQRISPKNKMGEPIHVMKPYVPDHRDFIVDRAAAK